MKTIGMKMNLTSKNLKESIASHIEGERSRVAPAMRSLRELVKTWYRTFEMDETSIKKNLPFQGATAVFLPLLFEQTKLVYGKLWSILFRHRPLLQVSPLLFEAAPALIQAAKDVERSLDNLLHVEVRVREKLMPILLDGIICGTSFANVIHRRDIRMLPLQFPGMDVPDTEEPVVVPRITYSGADIEHIPLMHATWPPEAPSVEKARWFEIDRFYSGDEILEFIELNLIEDKDAAWDIIKGGADKPSEWLQMSAELTHTESFHSPQFHMKDWWGWFRDPDKKELPRLYNVLQHASTGKVLTVRYNPYEDQSFPIASWSYFPRPYKILGIGAGRLLTSPNEALNEIWNQRVNAGRIANTKVFKIRRGAGIKPSEKIYPGKRLYLTNPDTDVKEMNFGDVKQSAYADENSIIQWADRVMSTNSYARGEESITRPTASGQLSLIQMTNENISIVGDGLRIFLGRVGRLVYSRYRQFSLPSKLLPSYSPDIAAFFLPSLSAERMVFDLAAADERINEEADRQKLTASYQMFTGYYQTLLTYAEIISSPETPPFMKLVATKASQALTEFMKRIGRNLNLQGFESFLIEEFENANQSTPGVPALTPGAQPALPAGQAQLPGEGSPGGIFRSV